MPEDATQAPAQTQDTPPEQTNGTPEVDYQKRYDDLRPQFDRTTQELAQAREAAANWERFQTDPTAVLAELGYQVEDDEPQYIDPNQQLAAEVAQIKQTLTEQQQKAAEAQRLAHVEAVVERELAALPDVDESDKDWLLGRALALPPTPDGLPDIKAAHAELVAWEQTRQKRWAKSKQAPHVSPAGQAGVQTPDLSDPQAMLEWQMQRLQDLNAAS